MLFTALVFGLSSYNLFFLLRANLTLIFDFGVMALLDGAFVQFLSLAFYGIVSLSSYLLFKACEKWLVSVLLGEKPKP